MFSRFDFRRKTATKSNKKGKKEESDIFSSPHLRGRRDFFLSEKKDDGWIPSFFFFSPKKNWRKYKSGRDLNDGKALIFTEEQQRKFQQQRRRRCKYPPSNFSKIVWEIVGRGQKVFLAIKMRPPPARREGESGQFAGLVFPEEIVKKNSAKNVNYQSSRKCSPWLCLRGFPTLLL